MGAITFLQECEGSSNSHETIIQLKPSLAPAGQSLSLDTCSQVTVEVVIWFSLRAKSGQRAEAGRVLHQIAVLCPSPSSKPRSRITAESKTK
jgi:hypothetical protein